MFLSAHCIQALCQSLKELKTKHTQFLSLRSLQSHVAQQSERIALTDPHGWKISVVSIGVILLTLCLLFLCYFLIGKIVGKFEKRQTAISPDISPIDIKDNKPHDQESYKLTIKQKAKSTLSIDYSNVARITSSGDQDDTKHEFGISRNTQIHGSVQSPLPGIITEVKVKVGDKVSIGQTLAKLEAMKMENSIEAEVNGSVTEVYVSKGDSVLEGTALMKIQ